MTRSYFELCVCLHIFKILVYFCLIFCLTATMSALWPMARQEVVKLIPCLAVIEMMTTIPAMILTLMKALYPEQPENFSGHFCNDHVTIFWNLLKLNDISLVLASLISVIKKMEIGKLNECIESQVLILMSHNQVINVKYFEI